MYDAYKQVTGLAEPTYPKLVQRHVRGLLKHVFGVGSSKYSTVQRNLLGTPTDAVKGRCPTCGHMVAMPCLACRVRADRKSGMIRPAGENEEPDEEEGAEPDLLFR